MKTKKRATGSEEAVPRVAAPVATIAMVAEASGVSLSTVSRILNGTAVVSAEKRTAVERAIAQLQYVPNPVARGLAGGRTASVGVITQAIDSPFYGMAMRGIEDEFSKAGFSALFVSGNWDSVQEAHCLEVLRSRHVDGIIALSARFTDQVLRGYAKTLPIVVTGRSLKAPGLFALNFDNFEGGWLATHHLLTLGHRRIAFIAGDQHHDDAGERLRGYRAALEAAGLQFNPALVVPGTFGEESGLLAVERLLDRREPFTAIFSANDQMAFGAALALHRRALRVPEDVSLIGFDDLPGAMFQTPPLSSVRQPVYELGRLAAAAMLDLLAGNKPAALMPGPRLMARESTRALAPT